MRSSLRNLRPPRLLRRLRGDDVRRAPGGNHPLGTILRWRRRCTLDGPKTTRRVTRSHEENAVGQGIGEVLTYAIAVDVSLLSIIAVILMLFSSARERERPRVPPRMDGHAYRGRERRRLRRGRSEQRRDEHHHLRHDRVGEDRVRRAVAAAPRCSWRNRPHRGSCPRCRSGWRVSTPSHRGRRSASRCSWPATSTRRTCS